MGNTVAPVLQCVFFIFLFLLKKLIVVGYRIVAWYPVPKWEFVKYWSD